MFQIGPEVRSAWMGFILFLALTALLQEHFPLTHFNLTKALDEASSTNPEETQVARIVVLFDGKHGYLDDFERFSGLDHASLLQPSGPAAWGVTPLVMEGIRSDFGLAPTLRKLERALQDRALPEGDAPGPHEVDISIRVYHLTEDGSPETFTIPLQKGNAWPAS